MSLKSTVDKILKEKNRSLSWLAHSIGKTFDGLRLALINESIKYKDITLIATFLEVHPGILFDEDDLDTQNGVLAEPKSLYGIPKISQSIYDDMVNSYKDQLRDKERIIELLTAAK